jgi:hypothetical protein
MFVVLPVFQQSAVATTAGTRLLNGSIAVEGQMQCAT